MSDCRVVGCRIVGCLIALEMISAPAGEVLVPRRRSIKERKKYIYPRYRASYIWGELNTSMVFDALRENKCLGKGRMGRWEEGHELVSRGVLETEHNLR